MAELLLHIALVDFGRGGGAGAQRMPGKFLLPLSLGKIAAHAGGECRSLDQPGNMFVGHAIDTDGVAIANHSPE